MAQSPEDMARTMIVNMPAKTGKSLDEWVAIIKASGLEKHGEMIKLLKTEHGMTHGFGSDVELAPKKAYVSLRRTRQFGLIQPSTNTRLDLGLNLKGVAPNRRLEASGSFNAMCTHRVRLESVSEVDAEVIGWLRQAYDAA